jgi:Zn-finger nucleic acid-binding protein
VWFDNRELEKVDEAHEHKGEALLSIERDPGRVVDASERRACPRCETEVMMRHFFSVKEQVEVDRCPRCNGTWLDLGELRGIREAFPTEAERIAAAHEHFDRLFGEDLARMLLREPRSARARRGIARLFRFLLPSYYIPGKQKWGAF